MNGYLKCYYGYKNRGDELLAIGVIQRIFHNYDIKKLYIESGDERWMMNRLKTNNKLLEKSILEKIKIVGKNGYKTLGSDFKLFIGGGELFTDQRSFPHDGWNYLLKFWKQIYKGNVIMLGGIGKPRFFRTKLLYNLTLRKAEKIVVREKTSFDLAKKYNKNTELYHDFALDVIDVYKESLSSKKSDYVIINVNSHVMKNRDNIDKIFDFTKKHEGIQFYFFSCDFYDDLKYYEYFLERIPNLELYDWTKSSIKETLEFLAGCEDAIGTRLHFLLVLKHLGKSFETIVYQEKIEKLILQN